MGSMNKFWSQLLIWTYSFFVIILFYFIFGQGVTMPDLFHLGYKWFLVHGPYALSVWVLELGLPMCYHLST